MPESGCARRSPPDVRSDAVTVGRWRPATPVELTTARLQLSAALHDGAPPSGADENASERLVLAFEEPVSNAVRHAPRSRCR
ncbi:hypothetical protein ACI8AR_16655 [Geodermatophilus sp. SYSU D01036]